MEAHGFQIHQQPALWLRSNGASSPGTHAVRQTASNQMLPLHCGQFLLGCGTVAGVDGWTKYVIGKFNLFAHPELSITIVEGENGALALIGFILDPADPMADDRTILARLLRAGDSIERLLAATNDLGGRWALVAVYREGSYLFSDALGLRQVFHMRRGERNTWAMSQPGLALDFLDGELDPHAMAFSDSRFMRTSAEYRWPGTSSPVRGLRHLLPNHVLNLDTGDVRRYWPTQALPVIGIKEGVDRIADLMSGMMRAAAARFDLAMGITAGLDSRLVLAAARSVSDQITYVTVRQAKMADDHDDVRIPPRVLADIGMRHEVLRAAATMSPEFSWAFKRSVYLAHDHYGADAETILFRFARAKVAVTGSGAEVGRCSYREEFPFSRWRCIRPRTLARLHLMDHPYAIKFFEEWLDGIGDRKNISLLDLFEWEQDHGNWLAMTQLEFDIAWRDIFTPFNCRALLTTFLSIPEPLRRGNCALFMLTIKRLWPQILREPINPGARQTTLRSIKTLLLQSMRSYSYVD